MNSPGKHNAVKLIVHGQASWRLASDQVEAFVTETGGHLGPVAFDRRARKLKPYSVAPWADENVRPRLLPILQVLRGDVPLVNSSNRTCNERPLRSNLGSGLMRLVVAEAV